MQARHYLGLLLLIPICIGCGGVNPVPIKPRVMLDGQPLSNASISFFREGAEEGRAGFGRTNSEGVATLTTFKPGDGVLPGSYRVVVTKSPENPNTFVVDESSTEQPDAQAMLKLSSMAAQGNPRPRRRRVRSVLPEIYSDPGTTPLRSTIDSSTRSFDIEVTSTPQ